MKVAWLRMWHGRQQLDEQDAAQAEQEGQHPQMADGGIGQQPLQVVLEEGGDRREGHGHQAHAAHQQEPGFGSRQDRPQPGQQKDACLHHGGRVQIGADRRRRGHGMRQPEVERELGRLGETAPHDQHQGRQIKRRGLDGFAIGQDDAQIIGAGDLAQDQQAGDQRQTAHAGDGQRHARALPALRQVAPVADQQEGREAGQLPEDQQQQDVVRQDDPHHRALEQEQEGVEPPHGIALGQVEPGIDDHQQPDPQDQAGEHQPQRVQEQVEVQPQAGEPGQPVLPHLAGQDGRRQRQQHGERGGCDEACGERAGVASQANGQGGSQSSQKRRQGDPRQGQSGPRVDGVRTGRRPSIATGRRAPNEIPVIAELLGRSRPHAPARPPNFGRPGSVLQVAGLSDGGTADADRRPYAGLRSCGGR